jgi:serine/threonine protein kinase
VIRKLNGGGNGDVYQVTHKVHGAVALKVLRNKSTQSEPYRRFRQEAAKHSELSQRSFRGILPLLEFDVPERPDDGHPAWLVMPIAVPITKALGEAPEVSEAVLAVSSIADTLARLHQENIAHRDIKPNNLYKYGDEWVISDLGLIDIPDGEPLTIGAKALGPRNFIAPEMILSPDRDDCRPADVYSLGKTLWCLVAGQPIPPPGEHRPDLPSKRLDQWGVAHPRAFYLDRLMEQTSLENAADRPSMAMVAKTLGEWVSTPSRSDVNSDEHALADVTSEIATVMATLKAPLDARNDRIIQASRLTGEFSPVFSKMLDQLIAAGIPASGTHTDASQVTVRDFHHFADPLPDDGKVAAWLGVQGTWNVGSGPYAFLKSMAGAAISGDQSAIVAVAHSVSDKNGAKIVWQGSTGVSLLGSAALESEVARLRNEFIANIPAVLKQFLESIRSTNS